MKVKDSGRLFFVRTIVVQIPKFDAKPNTNPMPIRFGQMTLRTSEMLPTYLILPKSMEIHYPLTRPADPPWIGLLPSYDSSILSQPNSLFG